MNFKIGISGCLFFLFLAEGISAQQNPNRIIESVLESVAENQNEDFDYSEFAETLNNYQQNPINLNKTNKEQLNELLFLNPLQISNFLDHIAVNGKLIDVLELQSIDGFDLETIKLLLNFASINNPSGFENFSFADLKKNSKNDLMIRYGRILEQQAGFKEPSSPDKSHYLGSSDKVFTRYRFNYRNNLQFSLNMDKDAGEKLWNTSGKTKGPDFISASLFIKNLYKFKKIALGDYALQFGQGLTLWSGLSFGKGADIFSVAKQDLGLRAYTSVNEYSFLRGFATQIHFGRFDFTPFVSYRKLDASTSLNPEVNAEEINNFQITGLHRTTSEIGNKNQIGQFLYGGNLQYNHQRLSLGLTAYHTNYDLKFAKGNNLYNKFDFAGKSLDNIGFNYSYTISNIYIFGEFAKSLNAGYAFINGALTSLSPQLSLIIFHRNYQKNYYSFFNQAIAENTNAINEKGFYGGFQFVSAKKYEFNFYADLFKFPWLKFRVDAPSSGYELFSQFTYTPRKTTKFIFRYKIEEKQQNYANENSLTNTLETVRKQSYRFEFQHQLNKNFGLRNRAEISQYKKQSSTNTFGYLLYQDVIFTPNNSKFSGNLRYALFDTDGFDTRIYAYENDVLYGFSIPGFQNNGTRFYINGRYRVKRGLDFWMKYSLTKYNDVATVNSGLDQSEGNLRSEIRLQLRYQF